MNTSPAKRPASRSDQTVQHLNAVLDEVWIATETHPASGFERALEVIATARRLQETPTLALALRLAGVCCRYQGRHVEALPYLFEALDLFDSQGNHSQVAACQNEIGAGYASLGDYPDALDYFESSLKTSTLLGSKLGELVALYHLSTIHKHLQNHLKSLEYLQRSLRLCTELDDEGREPWILHAIGDMHALIGREHQENGQLAAADAELNTALEYLAQALRGARKHDDRRLIVEICVATASALTAKERFDEARTSSFEGLTVAEQLEDATLRARCLAELGRIELLSDKPNLAEDYLGTALAIFEELGIREDAARVHRELSGMHKTEGQYGRALAHFERFYTLDAELRGEMAERRAQALSAKLEIEKIQRESEFHRTRSLELSAINVRLQEQAELLDRQAREDGLTGLANRRHLEDYLKSTFAMTKRLGEPLCVVVADVDHFKKVNDRFSHAVGDNVLRQVADILRAHTRASDLAARFGGEEFVLVLPGVTAEDGYKLCQRIRQAVQNHHWAAFHPDLRVTISMGLSDDLSLEHYERLLAAADDRLYEAKNAGRNCVRPDLNATA